MNISGLNQQKNTPSFRFDKINKHKMLDMKETFSLTHSLAKTSFTGHRARKIFR